MTPLMQTLFDQLRENDLDRYIDPCQRDTYAIELQQLYGALTAVLPKHSHALLKQYILILRARALMDLEAMFLATFAAVKELA